MDPNAQNQHPEQRPGYNIDPFEGYYNDCDFYDAVAITDSMEKAQKEREEFLRMKKEISAEYEAHDILPLDLLLAIETDVQG